MCCSDSDSAPLDRRAPTWPPLQRAQAIKQNCRPCSWRQRHFPIRVSSDVSFSAHTYSCQCHLHPQLPPWFVRWRLWGFSDPFYLMSAPGEKFLNYWTGSVGDASGVLQAWVGLPLGPVECAWFSIEGENWRTGWINERGFNAGLKITWKMTRIMHYFVSRRASSWGKITSKSGAKRLFAVLRVSAKRRKQSFRTNKAAARDFELWGVLNTKLQLNYIFF